MENTTKTTEEKTLGFGEVMSMLESMNEGIKVISEQHGGIVSRLDGIDTRLDSVDTRLDGIDGRLNVMDSKIDRLQEDMVEVKFELRQKVSVDQFQRLERRVTKLERLSLTR